MIKNGIELLLQFIFVYILYASAENCGKKISGLHGYFSTPNYPAVYPNDLSCKWNISVPNGYYMMLNFTQFELEWEVKCKYDFVMVKSKNGTYGKFCGQRNFVEPPKPELPPKEPIVIHSGDIEVELQTDFSNEVEVHGFEAHFAALDIDECAIDNGGCNHFCHNFIGGYYCSCKIGYRLRKDMKTCIVQCRQMLLKKESGYIQSPEYPMNYPPRSQCDWHITAERGFYVNLEFLDFHIEDHHDSLCPYDKLLIEDEKSKMGPFCGKSAPKKYTSSSNWLIIEFLSDVSEGAKGFKAKYWLEPIKCPELKPPEFGFLKGSTNFTFKDEVTFSCAEGYDYIKGDIKRTCLANGTWSGKTGVCDRIVCPDPISYNARIGIAYNRGPKYLNAVAHVDCSYFYDLIGPDKMICQANRTWSNTHSYCIKTCGVAMMKKPAIEKCERGRHRVKSRSMFQPWVVALKREGKLICSGVLINQEWILTAGHCLWNAEERYGKPGKIEVVLGVFHWNKKKHEEMRVRKIKKTIFRREFDYALHSDVILIQLSSPVVTDSPHIQPICLPIEQKQRDFFTSGKNVASIGWKMNGPTHLTDRCIQIADKNKCMNHVRSTHTQIHTYLGTKLIPFYRIPTDIICTDATVGDNDFCKLPPGSPLVSYDQKARKWYLGGILTWGSGDTYGCNQFTRQMDMYSDISKYIDWIKKHTKFDMKYPDATETRLHVD